MMGLGAHQMAYKPVEFFGRMVSVVIGIAIILYSVLLLANSCLVWLQTGVWYHDTAASLLSQYGIKYVGVSWVGVQRIIDGFMNWPASLGVCLIGILFLYGGFAKLEDHSR
jgi:hypothetical protein